MPNSCWDSVPASLSGWPTPSPAQPSAGDDVRLTISERLSRYISEQFPKGKRGAVVVLNYKTNEILAMVSMPQFDPTNMDAALSDESAGALINRATQGLYPPGSTFKIVTLASALENLPDLNDFAFDCTGYYPRRQLFRHRRQRAWGAEPVRRVCALVQYDLRRAFAGSRL